MQNGVDNVERIHAASGIRAIAAAVYVAAAMTASGHVKHSGRGDMVLGRVFPDDPAIGVESIAALFERAEVPCRTTHEIRSALWQKMLMNCAYNAISALARTRYGRIAADERARTLMRVLIEEAVAVARSEGVMLSAEAMTDAAYTLGEVMSGALSSTAQDIARGKRTEIDSLNGYVVRRAAEAGIAVPANQALYTLVKLLERSEL
jgi:2-dehydropantoate 2-reductase